MDRGWGWPKSMELFVGTAVAQFTSPAVAAPAGSLAILSLDPQRRQVARVSLGGRAGPR